MWRVIGFAPMPPARIELYPTVETVLLWNTGNC